MTPQVLQRDASCPNGGVFYSCNTGFVGCCLVEACNPGIGCPADKVATPSKSSSLDAPTATAVPSRTAVSSTTSTSHTTREVLSSIPVYDSTLLSTPESSTVPAITSGPTALAGAGVDRAHHSSGSVPTAAIVGAVLGGVILIAMVLGLFFCLRHRKRTKVYKAAVYQSPYVTSDMSPHLPGHQELQTSRFAGLIGTKQTFAHQIDSREIIPAAEMGVAVPRHLFHAELPASNSSF